MRVQESLALHHHLMGVLAQSLSLSFPPGVLHLLFDPHPSPPEVPCLPRPQGAGARLQPKQQTLSAAPKHKESWSLEVLLGMFPVNNQGRSRSKTQGRERDVTKASGEAVCGQRTAY